MNWGVRTIIPAATIIYPYAPATFITWNWDITPYIYIYTELVSYYIFLAVSAQEQANSQIISELLGGAMMDKIKQAHRLEGQWSPQELLISDMHQ